MKLRAIGSAISAAPILMTSLVCHAQSCALCYTQAAAEKERFVQGLRNGIMVLIFPSFFICTTMILLAYRKRNVFDDSQGTDVESW